MVARDLSNLPRSTDAGGGFPPNEKFLIVDKLLEAWYADQQERDLIERPKADEALAYRASFAGTGCDRAMHYKITGADRSNPPSLVDIWRMSLGTEVHDRLQRFVDAISDKPNVRIEVEVPYTLQDLGLPGTGHLDIVIYVDDMPHTVVEMKSINGFGFKKISTSTAGPPEGAKFGAVLQGALGVAALGAKLLVTPYVSLEAISPAQASKLSGDERTKELRRIAAEWTFDAETCMALAQAEIKRVNNLLAQSSAGVLPARDLHDPSYPEGARVTNPSRGVWQHRDGDAVLDSGTTWFCDYCSYRDACIADGEGSAPTDATTAEF